MDDQRTATNQTTLILTVPVTDIVGLPVAALQNARTL